MMTTDGSRSYPADIDAAAEVWVGATDPRLGERPYAKLWADTSVSPSVLRYYNEDINPPVWVVLTADEGPTGPSGPAGQVGVIVGSFGQIKIPADLPPDGFIPIDWDGAGRPLADLQMTEGDYLIYEPLTGPTDPAYGDLWGYVPQTTSWLNVGHIAGPPGAGGPEGPTGPQGIEGPTGPPGPPLPLGGLAGNALIKVSDVDQDVIWTGGTDKSIRIGDNAGYFFPGNGGIVKRSGGGWVLRRHSSNAAIPIENNDGSAASNIVTEAMLIGTNYSVSWQNGFSGSCSIRVNPASVTVSMWEVECNVSIANDKQVYMLDWPAGVPDPPQELRIPVNFRNSSWACTTIGGLVLANAGGLNLHTHNQNFIGNDHKIDVSFTWTR